MGATTFEINNWRQGTAYDSYDQSYAYYQNHKNNHNLDLEFKAFWENFYSRKRTAQALALAYGGLQGWGMAGFALYMIENAELGWEAETTIAAVIALTVGLVNTWLVSPDLEKYIVFQEYKQLLNNHNISKKTIALTIVASVLFGGIVAFGIAGSLPTKDTGVIAPVFGSIAAVLALAEGALNIGGFDRVMQTGCTQKIKNLFDSYDDDKKLRAKMTFGLVIAMSIIGVIGIALVGSKPLANQLLGDTNPTNIGMTSIVLFLAALTQGFFYLDRAETLTKKWVPTKDPEQGAINNRKPIFNPQNPLCNGTQKSLWFANALFNAPGAYLGVTTVLGKCMGLHKTFGSDRAKYDSQNTFEQVFFQYGTSTEALITYGAGTLFFVAALVISLAANSPPPKHMADPAAENSNSTKKLNV